MALEKLFTYALNSANGAPASNGKIVIDSSWGWKGVSIQGTNSTSGTVTGTGKAGGTDSAPISFNNTKSAISIEASDGLVLDGITIDCSGGATADILAVL